MYPTLYSWYLVVALPYPTLHWLHLTVSLPYPILVVSDRSLTLLQPPLVAPDHTLTLPLPQLLLAAPLSYRTPSTRRTLILSYLIYPPHPYLTELHLLAALLYYRTPYTRRIYAYSYSTLPQPLVAESHHILILTYPIYSPPLSIFLLYPTATSTRWTSSHPDLTVPHLSPHPYLTVPNILAAPEQTLTLPYTSLYSPHLTVPLPYATGKNKRVLQKGTRWQNLFWSFTAIC